jgi:hypothetical protein
MCQIILFIKAGRLAEMFGEQEIKEYQKGLFYGAKTFVMG